MRVAPAIALTAATTFLAGASAVRAARPTDTTPVVPALAAPSGTEAPTGPVQLVLRLKAGQTHTFRLTEDSTLRSTLPNGNVRKAVTHSEAIFALDVERENPDGTFAVRVRPQSQTVTVDGRDVPLPSGWDAEGRATLARDGRFANFSSDPVPDFDGLDAENFLSTLFDRDASLPTKPLRIGEGWKDRVESPLDEKQPKITVNNTLLALDVVDGAPVARLLHVVAEPVQNPAAGDGVSISGKMEGGGLSTVSLNTGLVRDEQDTLRLKMDITAQQPDSDQTVNLSSEANIQIRVRALSPERP